MKIWAAVFVCGLLLGPALTIAFAGDQQPVSVLPQSYDLKALSLGSSKVTSGLESFTSMKDAAPLLPEASDARDGRGMRVEWSGEVTSSVVYKNTKTR